MDENGSEDGENVKGTRRNGDKPDPTLLQRFCFLGETLGKNKLEELSCLSAERSRAKFLPHVWPKTLAGADVGELNVGANCGRRNGKLENEKESRETCPRFTASRFVNTIVGGSLSKRHSIPELEGL